MDKHVSNFGKESRCCFRFGCLTIILILKSLTFLSSFAKLVECTHAK